CLYYCGAYLAQDSTIQPSRRCVRVCMVVASKEAQLVVHRVVEPDTGCIQASRIGIAGREDRHPIGGVGAIWKRKCMHEWQDCRNRVLPRRERRYLRNSCQRLAQAQALVREEEEGLVLPAVNRRTPFTKAR